MTQVPVDAPPSPPHPEDEARGAPASSPEGEAQATDLTHLLTSTHLRCAWLGLLVFTLGGVLLEVLLAWKAPWLVDAENSERRHLLRLAHAHGTLLSLVQVALVVTAPYLVSARPNRSSKASWLDSGGFGSGGFGSGGFGSGGLRLASRCLLGALVLVPCGFLLGALGARDGDPGPGIALVPLGAILLLGGVSILTLLAFRRAPADRS